MPAQPAVKCAVAFFDGQNLFYAAKHAFGYAWPNYDPRKLARAVCQVKDWQLESTYFYTGLPSAQDDAFWNHFWTAKLRTWAHRRANIFAPPQISQSNSAFARRWLDNGARRQRKRNRHSPGA